MGEHPGFRAFGDGQNAQSASRAPVIVRPVLPSQTAQLSRAMAWLSICAVVGQDWYALRR